MNTETQTISALLNQLEELTNQALKNLLSMDENQFQEFAQKREQIAAKLSEQRERISPVDRQKIQHILTYDSFILDRMHKLKDEAGEWMERKGAIRVQQNAYQHAYSMNSLFIDKRN